MHWNKHQSMLKQAHLKRPPDFAPNLVLEETIRKIYFENPSAFLDKDDLKNRKFYHAPRPGTKYESAVHPWPKGRV